MTITEHEMAQALEDLIVVCETVAAFSGSVPPAFEKAVERARGVMKRYYCGGAFSVFLREQGGQS